MGEAKRRKQEQGKWSRSEPHYGTIDLHVLPPVAAINGARIRELTGEDAIPANAEIVLRTFKAVVADRSFYVGFCLGSDEAFSAIGIAVIERLSMEVKNGPIHVVNVVHEDIAWDIVLRHLRTFTGQVLLFSFPNSDIYDSGTAEVSYSKHIRQFDDEGNLLDQLSAGQRRQIREKKALILNRTPPPRFYPISDTTQEDSPWIFRIVTPSGKTLRTAVWNGKRNYAHEFPADIVNWVVGDRIAIVQVDSPVGVNRRSSLDLTHRLSKEYDGVIHWAKDTETFESILRSFIRLDLQSASPPEIPDDWNPEVTFFAANGEKPPTP